MLPVAILAGGLATRLRPVTETVPKALVDVNGEPFLAHQLRLLVRHGFTHVVLCVGYRGAQIQEYAGDGRSFGLRIDYSFDGPELLGTAGAIRRALPLLGHAFFVLYGDSYLACDYAAVERAFLESGQPGLMTVFRNEGRWDSSNVEWAGGHILKYDKLNRTPAMTHIDYGLGAFHSSAFASVPEGRSYDLAAVYQELVSRWKLAAYEVHERFYEVGSLAGIHELSAFLTRSAVRAVFLDRDGVLNEAVVRDGLPCPPAGIDELRIVPDAALALNRLKRAGFRLIVVTNQPDVARGAQSRETVDAIHRVIARALPIDDFLVCCHDDADRCSCRKPQPGLLLEAAAHHGIDLRRSFLIGDRWRDIDAGAAVGCRTIWIDRHYTERAPRHPPDFRTESLTAAADAILKADS